jgi:hypothetical protein
VAANSRRDRHFGLLRSHRRGRYISPDEAELGYTEKDYDYAVATRKPLVPLLHKNPDSLAREETETESGAWERLKRLA